ncbi:MAG: hypothetical protein RRY95_07935 [Oscillospiraceae bacterium]
MTGKMKIHGKLILGTLALAIGIGTAAFYLLQPVRYLALDVNPSIELHINRMDQVMSVTGANADAQTLLQDYVPGSKKVNAVVDELMIRLMQGGYLAADKKNDVLITSGDDAASRETLAQVTAQVQETLQSHTLQAEILTQSIQLNPAMERKAAENHVSAGKMAVIDRLMAGDATLTAKDLADTRVADLVTYAAEHKLSLDLMEDQLENLQAVDDTRELDALEDALDEAEDLEEDAAEAAEDAADKKQEAAEKAEEAKREAADKARDEADKKKDAEEEAAEAAADAKEDAEEAAEEAREAAEDAKEEAEDVDEDDEDAAKPTVPSKPTPPTKPIGPADASPRAETTPSADTDTDHDTEDEGEDVED